MHWNVPLDALRRSATIGLNGWSADSLAILSDRSLSMWRLATWLDRAGRPRTLTLHSHVRAHDRLQICAYNLFAQVLLL
jgi:hypothetical protein